MQYEHLDHTLDELDSWMNKLEEQNDNLSAELDALLESSRLVRRELQQEVSITAATEELQLDSGIASLNKGDFTLVGNMFEGTQDCDTWSSEVHNVQSVNESDTSVVQNVQSVHESDISGQDGSQTYSNDETYGVCTQANQDNS
ncbi:uncharacterized protein LOC127837533 isoform X2 [Dreissena polymorpha]|uniref:uncharacterized protein LOC127837533 isoform X2 n=1 Tax=Dreissena polymorpha TaxID=45954 RepID=UPI0022652BCD|nr:uncharacterized protein LOC127837533 isoform X2 [Dreissena polymorpha]